jgi:hypothetical protein
VPLRHLPTSLPHFRFAPQVYVSPDHIDDDLVRSIALPAQDPNAAEVFYRIITAQGEAMNLLLDRLRPANMPVYLLWGEKVGEHVADQDALAALCSHAGDWPQGRLLGGMMRVLGRCWAWQARQETACG